MASLTKLPAVHSTRTKKLLVLAPRKLFSSHERKAELKHFLSLLAAWKKLGEQTTSNLGFLLLSAKHPLEKPSGILSLSSNHFLSQLTGLEIESGQAVLGAGSIPVNFVESIGFEKSELADFLEINSGIGIPSQGWHHWPSTRWLVSDSLALYSAGAELLKHGKFDAVLAVGWPVFDSAIHLSKQFSLPLFSLYSTPSKLESLAAGLQPAEAVVARENAALKHSEAILSFDAGHLQWLLKNYSTPLNAGEKLSDFHNALEAIALLRDSWGLRQLLSMQQVAPADRRKAIHFLKQAQSALADHPVSHGHSFLSSRHCAAFHPPLELRNSSRQEISSAKRKTGELASMGEKPLSESSAKNAKNIFSIVFTDAPDSMLENFSKTFSILPDSVFLVKADAPKLAGRLKEISSKHGVAERIALMPERGQSAFLAACKAILFPNPVGTLLHYEQALAAVDSASQAGLAKPVILATKAAPLALENCALLSPAGSSKEIASLLKNSSELPAPSAATLELLKAGDWSWESAAQKMMEFLSSRL